ncbi:MAG: methyltransferase family protein [Candidatus Thorarchaeota archaeon]|jgi:protein-S-isoprenylcysteine O-methyltransferase Ste14
MIHILFYIVLFADIILLLGLVFSILFPQYRIWPPPSKTSWQYWASWIFITIASVGVPLVGFLDWDSLGPIHWIRFFIGGIIIPISSILAFWGLRTLSIHQSLGLEGELVTAGPYQYSRNPQYLALILFYISMILITSSYFAFISGILLILMYAITPLSEEPWLEDQFGEAYIEYRKSVSRFLGFSSQTKEV